MSEYESYTGFVKVLDIPEDQVGEFFREQFEELKSDFSLDIEYDDNQSEYDNYYEAHYEAYGLATQRYYKTPNNKIVELENVESLEEGCFEKIKIEDRYFFATHFYNGCTCLGEILEEEFGK